MWAGSPVERSSVKRGLCIKNVGWLSESLPAACVLWSNTFRHFKLMIGVWNVYLYGSRNHRVQSFQQILKNIPSHIWLTDLCAVDGDVTSSRPTALLPYYLLQYDNSKIWPDFRILRFSRCNKACKLVRSYRVIPYSEYICIAFYLILKGCVDCLMRVVNSRNM
jgi:hypothetical protein